MNNFLVRSASAVVFAGVLLGALFFHYVAFAAVIGVCAVVGLWEYARMMERIEVFISKVPYVIGGGLLLIGFAVDRVQHTQFAPFVAVLLVLVQTGFEIGSQKGTLLRLVYRLFGYLYIVLPFGLTLYLVMDAEGTYRPEWMLILFAIIWCNDTFAYLVGMTIGKNRMCPRVSPKKSWEGFAGGMISAVGIAGVLTYGFSILPIEKSLVMALSVAVAGVLGDLLESLLKRTVNIKDSGNIIPGHGGILDRFDAVLLAVPVMYLFLM